MVYLQTPARYAAFNNATVDTPRLFGIPDKLIDRRLPLTFRLCQRFTAFLEIVSAASGAIATISRHGLQDIGTLPQGFSPKRQSLPGTGSAS